MRYSEIMERLNVDGQIKRFALDLLIPLEKKGADSVSVEQLKNALLTNPDVAQGIDLGDDHLADLLKDLDIVDRIELDSSTDKLTIYFKPANGAEDRYAGKDRQQQDKDDMDKTAKKQAGQELGGGDFDL